MSTDTKRICRNDHPATPNRVMPGTEREKWTQKYAVRILKLWLRWQTPLGVAGAYATKIRNDLVEFYEDPLKRLFIEATY